MKSLRGTAVLLKNSFFVVVNPSAISCQRLYCLSALSAPSPLEAPLYQDHHRHPHRTPYTQHSLPPSTAERLSFSTLSNNTNLQQRYLLTSVTSWPRKKVTGWGLPRSFLNAITRFQSQLNLICANEVSAGIRAPGRSIDCEELIHMVEEGVRFLLIDVRDRKEVELNGSIQGAKLIPLPELKAALLMDEDEFMLQYGFPKPAKSDRNIVFYGQGAVKSNSALEIAGKLGYKGVLRMAGGYDEWIEKTHLDGRI